MSWQDTSVAADRTHHVVDDRPLYAARFHEVLKFHSPGLAPVLDDSGAYHVDPLGRAAYIARFRRTFGFYGDRAAVDSGNGWLHVLADGSPLYPERYDWCGNYQDGRCTVRAVGGRYLYLDVDGRPVCDDRWVYAGDYRDGVAVVHADDGRCTHVDRDGRVVHGRWFVDLDVFHKGFARARDARGWCHVDSHGRPVYPRRFMAVEPFYNGQARVEREDGGVEVIDESGRCVVEVNRA